MTLTVFERLLLLNILPAEGDITALRILRKLRETLSFSEEEHALLKFRYGGDDLPDQEDLPEDQRKKVPEGQVFWVQEAVEPKDIEITGKAFHIVSETLKKLNDCRKLRQEHVPLYEKFVEIEEV